MSNGRDRFAEYWAAHDWLLSLIQDPEGKRYLSHRSRRDRLADMRLQLPRLRRFLKFIGNPQSDFRTIHVAGTSGKGSVTTMVAGFLTAAGIRTGLHVSPYLQLCNEKLVLNGAPISSSGFTMLVAGFRERYMQWRRQDSSNFLKYGEAWVALTLMYFQQSEVEWAVIETGMGGRFDPTNVVDSQVAIITNVDFDHTESLGDDLEAIAWHKAGIIKPMQPVLTAEQKPAPLTIIEREAAASQAPLYRFGSEFDAQSGENPPRLRVKTPFRDHTFNSVGLSAPYQVANASLVVMAAELVRERFGLPISAGHVRSALTELQVPGRFELVQTRPRVILDGAHNPAKMRALVSRLAAEFPGQRFSVVFGMLGIKDGAEMLRVLSPLVLRWYLTEPSVLGKPPMPVAQLAELVQAIDSRNPLSTFPRVEDALQAGLREVGDDGILVVTGSLYLVGAARNHWMPLERLLDRWEGADGPPS